MARQVAIALGDYADGTHTFGPANLNNNVSVIGVEVQRCTTATPDIWPLASSTIDVALEISYDDGATWLSGGRAGGVGGIHVHRDGYDMPYSWLRYQIPDGTQRKIRGTVTITGGPIRTSANVILE